MFKRTNIIVSTTAMALLPIAVSATNGYVTHGIGVRSQGVAGVGYALAQDSLTAAANPAATALVGNRLDVGASWFTPTRGATITGNFAGADGNYNGNETEHFIIPEIGYTRQLSDELAIGLAIYANGGMNTDYETNPFAAFGSTGDAGVNLEQLFITPSVAYNLSAKNTVGAAATFAYQRFEMKGIGAFDNPFYTAAPGFVSDNGRDSSNGWGMKLGWIGQVSDSLRIGASWSSEIDMEEFSRYRGLFAQQGGFDIPEAYGVGLAWEASAALTLAADWQTIKYGDIKSVANPLQNLLTGNPLGSSNGGGFGWDDVDVIKLGLVYLHSDQLTLRAGVSRASQPIPKTETFFNILAPGTIRDHVSLGGSWKLSDRSEISLAYTHALKETVKGSSSIPMSFGGGEADIGLKEEIFSASYTINF